MLTLVRRAGGVLGRGVGVTVGAVETVEAAFEATAESHESGAPAGVPTEDLSSASRFGGTSRWIDRDGPLHVIDYGGRTDGDVTFLLIHGFGGSYLDWSMLVPHLRNHGKVHAVDLPAFGLSPAAGRSGDVLDDARLLADLIRTEIGVPVVLVGNSRGGLVAALTAREIPDRVAGVVLLDPALPAPGIMPDRSALLTLAPAGLPFLGAGFVRLGRSRASADMMVATFLDYCFADQRKVPRDYKKALRELLVYRQPLAGNDRAVAHAAHTTLRRVFLYRSYDGVLDRLSPPVLLIHGTRDRLVPVQAALRARSRRPHWQVHLLDDVGHTPQLEAPQVVSDLLSAWLDTAVEAPGSGTEERLVD